MSLAPDTLGAADLFSGPRLEALAELCRRFHVRTLDVFGSAVTGRPVDVLSEAALENPFLRRSVEATRRRLFPSPAKEQVSIDPAISEKRPAKYLWDALRGVERIARSTKGRTFDDYLADDMFRDAVERRLTVVGEAFAALRRMDPALAAKIPDVNEIIGFRNVLVHMYEDIHHDRVWQVIDRDLPTLRATLERLLGEASGP